MSVYSICLLTGGVLQQPGVQRATGSGAAAGTVAAWRFGDTNSGSSRDWAISNGYADGATDIGALSFAISSAANGDPLAGTSTVILRLTSTGCTVTGTANTGTHLPNLTASFDLGITGTRWRNLFLSDDATIGGGFGCNGKSAQTAVAAGSAAPAGGTGATAGAYDTAAHRDALITLVNNIRTALMNCGIMS